MEAGDVVKAITDVPLQVKIVGGIWTTQNLTAAVAAIIALAACIAAWWKASAQSKLLNESLKQWQKAREWDCRERMEEIEILDLLRETIKEYYDSINPSASGMQLFHRDRRPELDDLIEKLPGSLAAHVRRICHDLVDKAVDRSTFDRVISKTIENIEGLRDKKIAELNELK